MRFVREEFLVDHAPNTRETFHRQVLHQFVEHMIVDYNPDRPDLPTNSPHAHYAITQSMLDVLRDFGQGRWQSRVDAFLARWESSLEMSQRKRAGLLVPVRRADGTTLKLSPGKHSMLQVQVVETFAPRFAPRSRLVYLGDTADKDLFVDEEALASIGFKLGQHEKLPDVVLFDSDKKRLFLIEAVTSHGPMSATRLYQLRGMLRNSDLVPVFVTAFPNLREFKKHLSRIAWETEVWIAEIPDHMIHYNGDRFFPRS